MSEEDENVFSVEEEEENIKTEKELNMDRLAERFGEWLGEGRELSSRGDRLMLAILHGGATLLTNGAWVLIIVLLYAASFLHEVELREYFDEKKYKEIEEDESQQTLTESVDDDSV